MTTNKEWLYRDFSSADMRLHSGLFYWTDEVGRKTYKDVRVELHKGNGGWHPYLPEAFVTR